VIVYDAPDRVAAFVGVRVGAAIVPPYTAIGLQRAGRIVAGCVFNVYTGPDVQVTVAAEPGAITRAFVRACGQYVFGQLACERATIETQSAAVAGLATRLGGLPEGLKRNAFGPGLHAYIVGVLRDDWKL
jgi:hypothetical protein